jgi:hypothetical protein
MSYPHIPDALLSLIGPARGGMFLSSAARTPLHKRLDARWGQHKVGPAQGVAHTLYYALFGERRLRAGHSVGPRVPRCSLSDTLYYALFGERRLRAGHSVGPRVPRCSLSVLYCVLQHVVPHRAEYPVRPAVVLISCNAWRAFQLKFFGCRIVDQGNQKNLYYTCHKYYRI